MPTKIFMASAEEMNKSLPPLNRRKARYRLATFYYMRTKKEDAIEKILYDVQPEDSVFFIDSGAFTTMQKANIAHAKKDPDWWWDWIEKYVESYCEFLQKHKKRIFCAAEFDVDDVFTTDEIFDSCPDDIYEEMAAWWNEVPHDGREVYVPPPVLRWRRMIQSTGVTVVPCWHDSRRAGGWTEMLEGGHSYLAVASRAQNTIGRVFSILNGARKAKIPVHLFGLTKPDWIRKLPAYSVDSTTWLDGSKYGTTILFQNGRLRYYMVDKKDVRKRYRKMYESWGLDWKKVEEGDAYTMDECNLISWLQYADFIAKSPAAKDYWEKEANGAPYGSLGPVCDWSWKGDNPPEEPLDYEPKEQEQGYDEEEGEPMEDLDVESVDEPLDEDAEEEEPSKALVKVSGPNQLRLQVPNPDHAQNMMRCDNCILNERCDFFEAGAACHYKFHGDCKSAAGILEMYTGLIQIQQRRVQFASLQEQIDGGQLDNRLSQEIRALESMFLGLKELVSNQQEPTLEVKARGQGPISMILGSLMSNNKRKRKKDEDASETPVNTGVDAG